MNGKPKPLAVVGGRTILDRTIAACSKVRLTKVVLVSGYGHEVLLEAAASTCAQHGVSCQVVYNPDFATKNNCYSLLVGMREAGDTDVLLINGDVVFDLRILEAMAGKHPATALAVDSSITLDEESMKVASDGVRVLGLSKKLAVADSFGEYIGVATFSSGDAGMIKETLSDVVRDQPGEYYEEALQRLCGHRAVRAVDVAGLAWQEIDNQDDFQHAVRMVQARGFQS